MEPPYTGEEQREPGAALDTSARREEAERGPPAVAEVAHAQARARAGRRS